jgi:hypothetical protein
VDVFGKIGFLGIVGLAMIVLVSRSDGDAAQATVAQSCPSGDGGGVTVAFVWPAPGEGAFEAWLDLGLGPQFDAATSQGYGPFDPAQTSYAVAGLPERTKYHYRVQARKADGWHEAAKGTFTAKCGEPPVTGGITQRCVEGPVPGPADDGVTGTFSWLPNSMGEQWLDVSVAGPDFAPGMYQGYGPVVSGVAAHEIEGLARGTRYWWRVNVRGVGGWLTSAPAEFSTLPCPRIG